MPGRDEFPHAGYPNGDPLEMPADLTAVQADDVLLDLIGRDWHAPGPGDDELTRMLSAWRQEVQAEPVAELVDTNTALAIIQAARRPARRRNPVFGPIAAAAAVLVIAFSAVGLVAKSAQPGDQLWGVTQVLYSDYARSVETAAAVRTELNEANTALRQGNPDRARAALRHVQQQLPVIGESEGRTDLTARHRKLEEMLQGGPETGSAPPGAPSPFMPRAGAKVTTSEGSSEASSSADLTNPPTPSMDGMPSGMPETGSGRIHPGRDYPGRHYPRPGFGPPDSRMSDGSSASRVGPPSKDLSGGAGADGAADGASKNGSEGDPGTPDSTPADPGNRMSDVPRPGHLRHNHHDSGTSPMCERPGPRPPYCG
ncbi:MAG: anti-sigma-D factor RsdA [Pseudonocardiaceae bacterium]